METMERFMDTRLQLLEKIQNLHKYEKQYGLPYDNEEFPASAKATTPFRPYRDHVIDMNRNSFKEANKTNTEVDDHDLENFITRVLTNQAMAMAEGREHYEEFDTNFDYDEDNIPDMYKIRSAMYGDDRLPKKKVRNFKRGKVKRSKLEEERLELVYSDLPDGSELSLVEGEPMVNLSIAMLRQYMYTEVESRVRHINDYYLRQWDMINRERLETLGELIHVRESSRTLQKELDNVSESLRKYKDICDNLGSKVETSKDAKRRRRLAKKQRKNEKAIEPEPKRHDDDKKRQAGDIKTTTTTTALKIQNNPLIKS